MPAMGAHRPDMGEAVTAPTEPTVDTTQAPAQPAQQPPATPPVPTPSQVFPPQQPQQTQPQNTPADLTDLTAVIAELGLTPAQIKGRLEASRKWEDRAKEKDPAFQALKEKAEKFDQLQAEAMSEQEKAVAAARAEGRAQALAESGERIAETMLRAALHGRRTPEEIDDLFIGLDRKSFLTADGLSVDADKVTRYVNVVAPAPVAPAPTPADTTATPPAAAQPAKGADRQVPDMGQGNRTTTAQSGLAAGAEIAKARAAQRIAPPVIAK